jgi:hypothetical protein
MPGGFCRLAASVIVGKISGMSSNALATNVLDLTAKQTLFELAIADDELIGPRGVKLLSDIKTRAAEADYTHLYYRDPLRPGIIWMIVFPHGTRIRAKIDHCHSIMDKVFPGLLESLDRDPENNTMTELPMLSLKLKKPKDRYLDDNTKGISALDLVTALEYLVFIQPGIVRAWAALMFAYSEIFNLREGAQEVQKECTNACPQVQLVSYLID